MKIVLPLPNPCLQPNKVMRLHWAKRHRAVEKARGEAALVTRTENNREWTRPVLKMTFYLRKPQEFLDDDSIAGWGKAYRDGVADGLGLPSDRRVITAPPVQLVDKANPRVEIEVVEALVEE